MTNLNQALPTPEVGEIPKPPLYEVQSIQRFTDDFVAAVEAAGENDMVGLENMLFEVTDETLPIYQAMLDAKQRGVKDVRLHMGRIGEAQIRTYEDGEVAAQSVVILGQIAAFGADKESLQLAKDARDEVFAVMDENEISDPEHRERGHYPFLSHNHNKVAIVGDTAWIMTNNFRGLDYQISNFAIKVTDLETVNFIKEKFNLTEEPVIDKDDVRTVDEFDDGSEKTTLLFDGGEKGESVSMDRALEMVRTLEPVDEFTFLSQWPPAKSVFGEMDVALDEAMARGAKGTFLVNPPEKLSSLIPNEKISRVIKMYLDRRERKTPNMHVTYMPQATHAKALLVRRANGEREVICGTHDFAEWTVRNGTREMSIWSKDPALVDQIEQFIEDVQE